MGIFSTPHREDDTPSTDPLRVVGYRVNEAAYCNVLCAEAVLGRGEHEYESVVDADAAGVTCAGCDQPLLEQDGRAPRTFTCGTCGEIHTPGYATGDLFYCCGAKMTDSLQNAARFARSR